MPRQIRVATFAVAAALVAGAAAAQTPSVDELIAKNLAARGGEAKLKTMSSARLTGTLNVQGMDMPITIVTKRPNKMKQEMEMSGQKIVQAFDGETAWAINPMMGGGVQKLEGGQADAIKAQSLFDGPLVGYKDRGDTLEVVGSVDVEGTKTWDLKLTRKDGKAMHIFLDAQTGLERQWTASFDQNGMTMEINTIIGDYQPADGLMIARNMRSFMGGQQMAAVTITNVEFNPPLDDAIFAMPK